MILKVCTSLPLLRHSSRALTTSLQYGYPLHILYILSLGFSRSSLLLQLIRLAPTPRLRKAFWFLFGFSTCFTLAAFLSHALICKTKPYLFWESKDPTADVRTGRCISYGTLQLVMGVINIFTDFVVWLSPLQIIYSVRLPRSQKVGLFIVFAFGGLCVSPSLLPPAGECCIANVLEE